MLKRIVAWAICPVPGRVHGTGGRRRHVGAAPVSAGRRDHDPRAPGWPCLLRLSLAVSPTWRSDCRLTCAPGADRVHGPGALPLACQASEAVESRPEECHVTAARAVVQEGDPMPPRSVPAIGPSPWGRPDDHDLCPDTADRRRRPPGLRAALPRVCPASGRLSAQATLAARSGRRCAARRDAGHLAAGPRLPVHRTRLDLDFWDCQV